MLNVELSAKPMLNDARGAMLNFEFCARLVETLARARIVGEADVKL